MKLFVFGPTGDLVRRKVLPALQVLSEHGSQKIAIWALGRRDFTNEQYREFVCQGSCTPDFAGKLNYRKINLEKKDFLEDFLDLFDKEETNFIYIALPPENIDSILIELARLKEKGADLQILIEKPFGKNLKHALALQKIVHEGKLEEDIYLADHYLFKERVVQLKPRDFKRARLISLESVGLEGRNSYYESIGALKDMVQSHFLNIIFKLIENPEKDFENFEITELKRMQYISGDKGEKGYREELGKESETETFIELKISSGEKNFEFITGKGFEEKLGILEIDSEKVDLHAGDNAYISLFSYFFQGDKGKFPSIENALLAWKIIEKIELKKPKLGFYKRGERYLF